MMAELWDDIESDFASAKKHLGQAVAIFDKAGLRDRTPPDYVFEMAFLHAMQSGYTSFEAGLKRLLALLGEALPVGGDSHAALLRRAHRPMPGSRPAILDDELFRAADDVRRFRHVATHTYDHFNGERAALAVRAARSVLDHLDTAVARFRAAIDPGT